MMAAADCRIVTVGSEVMVWRRQRQSGQLCDWRHADPEGLGFVSVDAADFGEAPARLAAELGLSFSVQDWMIINDVPLFLEVNPRGQWLFLRGADKRVVSSLVEHLVSHV